MTIHYLSDPNACLERSGRGLEHSAARRPLTVSAHIDRPSGVDSGAYQDVTVYVKFPERFTFCTWTHDGVAQILSVTVEPFGQPPMVFLPEDLPMPAHAFGEFWPAGTVMKLAFRYVGPMHPFTVHVVGYKD